MSSRFFPFALVTADPATGLRAVAASTPIDQQLADAFNANNAVLAYTTGIAHTNLPAIPVEPDWYKKFKTQFAQTKIHAMKWTNSIAPQLVSIPTGIADYAFTWLANMTNIDAALSVLVTDPTNEGARAAVVKGLNKLIGGLSKFDEIVAGFEQVLADFKADLAADAVILTDASVQSRQQPGYDRVEVQRLTEGIAKLEAEIKSLQVDLIGGSIVAGVSLFFGILFAVFTFGLSLAFGIAGATPAIIDAVTANAKIKEQSAKIAEDQAKMSDLNERIAILGCLVTKVDDLVKLAQLAGVQMQLLLKAWETLGTELKTVITDLEQAKGDVSDLGIWRLQLDLNTANEDWKTLGEFCRKVAGIQYLQATPATATLPTEKAAAA